MKFSLFRNNKSSFKDELVLALIVGISLTVGILLVVFAPSVWIFESSTTKVFGVLWIVVGAMFLPGLIYRLFTNDPKK
jgi:hypothetical protein